MAEEYSICNCDGGEEIVKCDCYYRDRRVIGQRMEHIESKVEYDDEGLLCAGGICVITYETGEVQRLKRNWMDFDPNH